MIYDENGRWTGKTLNKSYLISTDIDLEREEQEALEQQMARGNAMTKLPPPSEAAQNERHEHI